MVTHNAACWLQEFLFLSFVTKASWTAAAAAYNPPRREEPCPLCSSLVLPRQIIFLSHIAKRSEMITISSLLKHAQTHPKHDQTGPCVGSVPGRMLGLQRRAPVDSLSHRSGIGRCLSQLTVFPHPFFTVGEGMGENWGREGSSEGFWLSHHIALHRW